jgi:ATP-dependent DNA ligase
VALAFNLLQHHRSKAQALLFYVFNVLAHRGRSLLNVALSERREILRDIFRGTKAAPIALSESLDASPVELIRVAKEFGFEGR